MPTQENTYHTRSHAPSLSEISIFSRPAREVSRQLGLGRQEARSLSREWARREQDQSPTTNSLSTTYRLNADSKPPRHSRPASETSSALTTPSIIHSQSATSSRPQWRTQTQPAPSLIESEPTRARSTSRAPSFIESKPTRARSSSRTPRNSNLSETRQMQAVFKHSELASTKSNHYQSHHSTIPTLSSHRQQPHNPSNYGPPTSYSSDQSEHS